MDKLLNEAEAAKLFNIRQDTLTRWRWACKGPRYFKVGSAIRYKVSDLEAFIVDPKAEG